MDLLCIPIFHQKVSRLFPCERIQGKDLSVPRKEVKQPHLSEQTEKTMPNFRSAGFQGQPLLPQADELPPNPSNSKPNNDVDHGYKESVTPPLGKWDVVSTIENRC